MGVDTKGYLIGNVKSEEILNFIRQKHDKNATSRVKKELINYEIDWEHIKHGEEKSYREVGFIEFVTKTGQVRSLFYFYSNINSLENYGYYEALGLEDMVRSDKTSVQLGFNGESVEIIKELVSEFGGWIDENDCDEFSFYQIIKNSDGTIKPVFRVTMNEIYEKFGGVVIIKK